MRMTPLDIQNHRFASRLRGLDPEEVETFLRLVSDDVEAQLVENDALRSRVGTLESRLGELEAQERALRETLITAQALADDLKRTAVKESEVLIGQAEVRAEKILDAAHRRASRLAEDIREMKVVRSRIASAVRNTIETHLQLLDGLTTDDREAPRTAELLAAPLPRTEGAARAENTRIELALQAFGNSAAADDTGAPFDTPPPHREAPTSERTAAGGSRSRRQPWTAGRAAPEDCGESSERTAAGGSRSRRQPWTAGRAAPEDCGGSPHRLTVQTSGVKVQRVPNGIGFWIHVTPRAKRPSVGGVHGDALRVGVSEPPVEGRANAACVRSLAEALGVPRTAVRIDPAAKGRRKRVDVDGEAATLEARMHALSHGLAGGPTRSEES